MFKQFLFRPNFHSCFYDSQETPYSILFSYFLNIAFVVIAPLYTHLSLRTGSLRERKKFGERSVNLRAKRVGCGGACRHCFWYVLPPLWWLACYKSVKEVIKPVKIDVFFSVLMRRLFLIICYRTRVSRKCKSNGSVFAVSAKSCWNGTVITSRCNEHLEKLVSMWNTNK